jgi:DNA-binding SARP family transcriptional activator/tetratricopeptide (TPR) repeat protein
VGSRTGWGSPYKDVVGKDRGVVAFRQLEGRATPGKGKARQHRNGGKDPDREVSVRWVHDTVFRKAGEGVEGPRIPGAGVPLHRTLFGGVGPPDGRPVLPKFEPKAGVPYNQDSSGTHGSGGSDPWSASTAGSGMNPQQLEILLLGPLEVRGNGVRLDLPPSKKARALLAYLVASGRSHARSSLCDLLWQEVNDPRAGLRWALSKLRAVVEQEESPRIVTSGDRVGFQGGEREVDLHRIRSAISESPANASLEALEEARCSFRGEFLEGLDLPSCHRYQAWCLGMRERLRLRHVSVLTALTHRLREAPEEALPHALARLALDPFAEEAHIAAMELLGDLGRVDRALEVYEGCRRMLSDHLEAPPSEELEAARRRLGTSTRPRAVVADPQESGGGWEREASRILEGLPHPEGLPAIGGEDPILVGRDEELEALRRLVRGVDSGTGSAVALLTGEPGIGKTRLLREVVEDVRSMGGWAVAGQVFETEEVRPYGAWAEMLRQLPPGLLDTRMRRALSGLLTGPAELRSPGPTERTQLFDAVRLLLERLARARRPGLLVLDDVQWLDASSAALLHYVTRTLGSSPLVLALSAREGEVPPGSTTARVLKALGETGVLQRIPLRRLDSVETGALVHSVDRSVDPEPVFATSEGNPFFALAVAASLRDGVSSTPATIQEELQDRLARLDPGALTLLPWAAALGRAFDVSTLERVLERSALEIVEAIDGLERRGILQVRGGDRYDFTHSLLRQAAYRRPSKPARRAIHRRIAQAMDRMDRSEGREPGAMAHHAELGGLPRLSVQACIEAAEQSLWMFALDEAVELVERGLAQVAGLSDETRIPLEMGLLRIYSFRSMRERRPPGVEARVERVTEEARASGALRIVAIGHALLMDLQYQRGAFHEAARSSVRSADAGRESEPDMAIRALSETAACLLLLDQAPDDARRLADEAFDLAEEHGIETDVVWLARALLRHQEGDLEGASFAFGEVIRLGRLARDRWWECPALTRMVMVELDRGNAEGALARAQEAEEQARRMDDVPQAAFARALRALAAIPEPEDPALDEALEELRGLDSLWKIGHVQSYAAELELERGRADAARERAEETLAAARLLDRPSLLAVAQALLSRCAVLDGRPEDAAGHLEAPEITRPHHRLSYRARQVVRRAREAVGS